MGHLIGRTRRPGAAKYKRRTVSPLRRSQVMAAAHRLDQRAEAYMAALPAQTAPVKRRITAVIPHGPDAARHDDAPVGLRHSHAAPQPVNPAPKGDVDEPAIGETVTLPDIKPFNGAEADQEDAIIAALAYKGTVSRGGAAPSGFGVTRPYTHALSNISITHHAFGYFVSANLDNPITYQVRSSTGPSGEVDIDSSSDGDITAANYASVASDLTPDMSDLNGRPPRNGFWAKDLTLRHELFHANEDKVWGAVGTFEAATWLSGRTASSAAAVRVFLNRVPGKVAAKVSAEMAFPGREERAYGDGAPYYAARAAAIRIKGAAGVY